MSIRVWWMVAIFTSAVGLAIFFEEPPPGSEPGGQPAAQAEVRSAAVVGERPTHPGG